ncbi:MAG: GNAT family N-acetyltransferase [Chitinophagaceae bacterium]|nr:GNAT family N-acetyltransferase [Chitinophagaceae bacterium]
MPDTFPSTIIRPFTKEDLPTIFALFKEFSIFQKTPEKMHITLDQLMEDELHFQCFVAVVNGEVIGYATYFFAYYSWTGRGVYLDDLYVREGHRKYGIGRQLLDKVISFARENNCKTVRWLVSRWNTNAIEFYKKIGAHVDDTEMTAVLPL